MAVKTITWWEWAKFWITAHDRQTNGFTLDLDTLTDEELTNLSYVTDWLLEVLPRMANEVLHPKFKPKLKRAIPYLTDLHQRQTAVWMKEIKDGYIRKSN